MKVLLLNKSDTAGGAARAVYRLHRSYLENSIASTLKVGIKNSDDWTVKGFSKKNNKVLNKIKSHLSSKFMKLQSSENNNLHSPAIFPSGLVNEINKSDYDVVQLNWVCGEFLSIEDIGRINKPLVWRLSDMWPFSGAEHYDAEESSNRWKEGYSQYNRPINHKGLDIDRWVWSRKKRAWQDQKIHIVTPSQWMSKCVRNSYLMKNWPVEVIPTPINMKKYRPWGKEISRKIMGLSQSAKLILFGAMGGTKDQRKGSDLLQEALKKLSVKSDSLIEGVIFGQTIPEKEPDFGIPINWMGHVNDDETLGLLYSACDVMVVPSRQDNLPQTAIEAQASGCPLVAFNISGMPDALLHKETGYLANAFDTDDLAHGINWIILNNERNSRLSENARDRALELWSPEIIVSKYLDVYRRVIHNKFK